MLEPTTADGRDFRPALGGICFSWIYSVAWTVPPLLGWSKYGPEGPGTTCSVDWKTQTPNNISYIISLFTFCLVLPFGVIVYSYGKLLHAIRQASITPSLLAKCSTVVNPFIYVFMNKQFYRCFRAFFCCSAPQRGSSLKTFSRVTKTFRTVHQEKEIHATVPAPYTPGATPNSIHGSSQGANDVGNKLQEPTIYGQENTLTAEKYRDF
uniref:Teleost multiple tissue opsin b n=1 Tax=Nothobranchius pienaari TaxID=704102 RepID=A0A1A8LAS3_9TELE